MTSMKWSENRPEDRGRVSEKEKKNPRQKQLVSDGRCVATFWQRVAQTQRRHDVAHVAVDALGHSGVLRERWGKVTRGQFSRPLPNSASSPPTHTPGPSWPPPGRPSAWPGAPGRWRRQQTAAPQSTPAAPSSGGPGRC